MSNSLVHKKIAVLVANGFREYEMTETQKRLQKAGAHTRIISMDHGLVNSWTGEGWGHHFASDSVLSSALAVDYDMIFVPGGKRSIDKLKLTAHTKRFVRGFLTADKPVVLMSNAVALLSFLGLAQGYRVAAPQELEDELSRDGAIVEKSLTVTDRNLWTSADTAESLHAIVDSAITHLTGGDDIAVAA